MNGWIEEGEEDRKWCREVREEESERTDGRCNSEKTICCLLLLDFWEESVDPIPLATQLLLTLWSLRALTQRHRQTRETGRPLQVGRWQSD